MAITKLETVPLRQVFPNESLHLTTWLEENISALSERIGIALNVVEREMAVGSFRVDLLCEDSNGTRVIVENQIERTDHDHLGKLLTYMINLDAKIAIWIAAEIRPEHVRVMEWLNEIVPADMAFYLVKVEAVRIGDSPYAPLFTVLAQPDSQARQIGEEKKELSDREMVREQFWRELLARSEQISKLTINRSATRRHWLSVAAGRTGFNYNYLIWNDKAGIDLYIDTGDQERNKRYFDALLNDRDAIEADFGEPLTWERLDDKRSCRVVKIYEGMGGLWEQASWPKLQAKMIEDMNRLDGVMRHRIKALR